MSDNTKYKWDSPYEWLLDKMTEMDPDSIYAIARELAAKLDSDTLQDLFQAEMDEDGYFEPEEE